MKTSAVLASMLFGSIAVAAPFDRRALAYKTEVVTETVVVWTTVYDDAGVAEATTTPAGYFYEQPKGPSSAAAAPTPAPQAPSPSPAAQKPSPAPQAPSPVAPAPQQPSSQAPAPQAPTSAAPQAPTSAAPAPATSQAPAPVSSAAPVEQPQPATSAYVAPAPAASSAAPSTSPNNGGSPTGSTYSGDITIYDNTGGFGACGTALHDSDMIVALAKDAWGSSTYDVMTGAATNPWCGQKIKVNYGSNSIVATIMDLCPGCSGHDIDLSLSAWKALTGLDEKTRLTATWSKIS